MEKLPGHNPSVAPGMTQVIESGQSYTITDDNGAELELVGRDRPWVIQFLTAMDNYMTSAATLGDNNTHTATFRRALAQAWEDMPQDLRVLMPSYKTQGIRIDVHQH